MPNFWTKITQKAYECFNGPRTQDFDFDKKKQEVTLMKDKINQIRNILLSINERTKGFHMINVDIFNNFGLVFDRNTNYYSFMDDTCQAHNALDKIYIEFTENLKKVTDETLKWDKPFKDLDQELKKQVEFRKVYDHYDEKMEKLVKERSKNFLKGNKETLKDVENFENNENKYKEAANNYVNQSNLCYNKMQNLLDDRYTMIAPLIAQFLYYEKLFFDKCSKTMVYFNNVVNKVDNLKFSFQRTQYKYDASDYLRGKQILNRVSEKIEIVKKNKDGGEVIEGIIHGKVTINDKNSNLKYDDKKGIGNNPFTGNNNYNNNMNNQYNRMQTGNQNNYYNNKNNNNFNNNNYHRNLSNNNINYNNNNNFNNQNNNN